MAQKKLLTNRKAIKRTAFRYLTKQNSLAKNPMNNVHMTKKSNFMVAQNKES